VSFTVDAYPGEPFRGAIRDIRNAPQVVSNVVTYDAVIDVSNDELKLKPGMTATVSVVTDRRSDVLTGPNAALRFRPDGAGPPGAGPPAGGGPGFTPPNGGGRRDRGAAGGGAGESGERRARDADGDEASGPPPAPKRTIYVLVNGKPEPREITTGLTDGRVTEVTSGNLKEGENVIVSASGQNPNARGGQRPQFRIL
jgi:HlyD family secretion protein